MAAWQPQEHGVLQLCGLLTEFQKPGANQAQVLQQLDQCRAVPDFNNYLAFIFAKGDNLPIEVRQSAGLLLKNNVKAGPLASTAEQAAYIKGALLHVLPHPSKPLRHTAGTIAAALVGAAGMSDWPELVAALVQCLQSQDVTALDGSLNTLFKVVEDTPVLVEDRIASAGNAPASRLLLPHVLHLFRQAEPDIRRQAVAVFNMLTHQMPSGLIDTLDTYVQGLFALATDSAAVVRREVCIGLVQLLQVQPDKLEAHLQQIIEYMLACNQDSDEGVALESAEFWLAFCEAQIPAEVLRPFLPRLIPVLMTNMVFDEDAEEVLEVQAADASKEDSDKDLKPFHHSSAEHTAGDEVPGEAEAGEGEDGEEAAGAWTLRKCSAAGLDMLSNVFGDELLPVLLPIVEQRLKEPSWPARESAILALGAVSQGCHMGLLPHLQSLVVMLLPCLADPEPMVRIIACWSLSRYSHWYLLPDQATRQHTPQQQAQLDAVLAALLKCMQDHNRAVQESACSALANIFDDAGAADQTRVLTQRLPSIIEAIAGCVPRYSKRALRALYELVRAMANVAPAEVGEPTQLPQLLVPVLGRWSRLGPYDREQVPLMECVTALALAGKAEFDIYALGVFSRCMETATKQLEIKRGPQPGQQSVPQPGAQAHEPALLVSSLDCLSGLVEGLAAGVEPLVASCGLMPLLLECCKDDLPAVRQSAFALLGDLARCCISHVAARLDELLPLALANLEAGVVQQHANSSACNNAAWSLGELAIKVQPEQLAPHAERIAERLATLLALRTQRNLQENCAITLGRLAWVCPDQIAPHLGHFCGNWCQALRSVRDDVEKEQAFLGLCRLVRANPEAAAAAWPSLTAAICSWMRIRCEGLANEISQILHAFKDSMSAAGRWQQMSSSIEPVVRSKLQSVYGL